MKTHLDGLNRGRNKLRLESRRELISSLIDTELFSTRDFLNLLGVSSKSYNTVSRLRKEGKGFSLEELGRPELSEKDRRLIRDMFYENTHPSFNKQSLNRHKKLVPKRILNGPLRHIINISGLPYDRKTIRKYMPREVTFPRKQLGVCAICVRCAELIQELHRDFPQTQEGHSLEVHMHIYNKNLPNIRQLLKTRPKVKNKVNRKTVRNLKAIRQFQHHKQLIERNKRRESELKLKWPKGLVRFVADWKGGFVLGEGGPEGVSTDDDGNQTKGSAACFGGMLRFHNSLINGVEDCQSDSAENINFESELMEGNELVEPSGFLRKNYSDTRKCFISLLSMNPDHSSNTAIEYMGKLIEHPTFKEILSHPDVEIVEFKCDNASHFISGETLHYVVVDLPKILQTQLPNLKQVLYAPFTPRHGKTDLDRFFGWLTRHADIAKDHYKVQTIYDLKRAIKEGFDRSIIDRAAEKKKPILQAVEIHKLKRRAPKIEKKIFLPGLASIGAVSFLVFDKSIGNHVFADTIPECGYDLRDMISEI